MGECAGELATPSDILLYWRGYVHCTVHTVNIFYRIFVNMYIRHTVYMKVGSKIVFYNNNNNNNMIYNVKQFHL